jgi:hypothetical protein
MLWTSLSGSKPSISIIRIHIQWLQKLTDTSFSINQNPTPEEQRLMKEWIDVLVAFVNDDRKYDLGTTNIEQLKTVTPAGTIEIRPDLRWEELIAIGKVFAGEDS